MSSSNCQKCKQSIKLEDSINFLSPSTYEIISNSIYKQSSSSNLLNSTSSYSPNHSTYNTLTTPSNLNAQLRPLYNTVINNQRNPILPSIKLKSNQHQQLHQPQQSTLGPEESFFLLTESLVRPARNATATATNPNLPLRLNQQQQQIESNSNNQFNSNLNSQSNSSSTTPLTPKLNQLNLINTILSSNSTIDYPLCTECVEILINLMEKELEEGKKQRDKLILFEKEVNKKREENNNSSNSNSKQSYEKEISRLKRAEKQAIEELNSVEAKRNLLEKEKASLDLEEAELAEEEAEFWRQHSKNLLIAANLRDKTNSLQTKYAHDVKELEKLQKTNVYNDAFCIGQENTFGTINGLRLGRLPNIPVEWPEINAAWGHTLLLLHTIIRKFGMNLETYQLVPMGSFSRIEKLSGDKASYELYGSGDFAVTRLLQNRRFDMAMVAFLDCLKQVMEFVKERDGEIKLPHLVQKDRIGDVSIKLQFGSDETWTRALRHVLLDLKILLGRASL